MASSTSSVSTGTVSTSGSSTYLSGVSSGLDTDALVEAGYQAKLAASTTYKDKITLNESKISAYQTLQTNLAALQDAANALRSPTDYTNASSDVFSSKETYLTASDGSTPTNYVTADAAASAKTGSYSIVVEQVATANKQKSAAVAGSSTTLAGAWNGGTSFSGSITIGLQGGATANIAVNGSMRLADLKSAIDAQSSVTGISAQIVTVSGSEQRLVLTANQDGKPIQITSASGDDVASMLGMTDIQTARTAKFSIDGMEFERSSNTVTDAINGLTINLYAAAPGTTMTLSVEQSLSDISDAVTTFVDAYNTLRDFMDTQQEKGADGTYADTAVLHSDQNLRSIMNSVTRNVSGGATGLSAGAMTTLGALGITLDSSNKLVIDSAAFSSALSADPDAVRKIFALDSYSSDERLAVTGWSSSISVSSFSVAVTANANGKPASVTFTDKATGTSYAGEVDSLGNLVGAKGTPFAGMELTWVGSGSATIDVTASQGIADKLYESLEPVLSTSTGSISTTISDLTDQDSDYQDKIDDITTRAEAYRDTLVSKYAAMESTLAALKTLLDSVKAQTDAWNGN